MYIPKYLFRYFRPPLELQVSPVLPTTFVFRSLLTTAALTTAQQDYMALSETTENTFKILPVICSLSFTTPV